MRRSRAAIEQMAAGEAPIYAVNTGVGLLADVRIPRDELKQLQRNVIRSHAAGTGEPLAREVVRAMMLIRANVLAMGFSGIRPLVAERLCDLLNHGVTPLVPSQGSVGASGDLAPLAHIALVLIGEGEAEFGGAIVSGGEALARAGVPPIELEAKEGISLINGTQAMLAIGCLELEAAETLADTADVVCALSLDALRGTPVAFDERIHLTRPQRGQMESARRLRELLEAQRNPPVPHRLPPRAGCLFAALRPAGAWRRARRPGRSAPRVLHRAQLALPTTRWCSQTKCSPAAIFTASRWRSSSISWPSPWARWPEFRSAASTAW